MPPTVFGVDAVGAGLTGTVVSAGTWLATQAVEGASSSLDGVAAIISAVAGLTAAVTALVLGLRSRRDADDPRVELLLELLKEQMDERDEGGSP